MQVQIFLLTSVEMSRPSSVIAGTVPECLLPVANREVLDIQLEALEKCGACRGSLQKEFSCTHASRQGFDNVTVVCPTVVVEAIRSWKTDVCQRKVQISFHAYSESLDTAEVLFGLREQIADDFVVVVGSVLFDAEVLMRALAEHRAREPLVTTVVQRASDRNTAPVPLSKSMSDLRYPANFVGYANDNRLIYIRSNSSIVASLSSSKVALKKAVLRRFPDMRISTNFFDGQVSVA
jgi:hypothetical protein